MWANTRGRPSGGGGGPSIGILQATDMLGFGEKVERYKREAQE